MKEEHIRTLIQYRIEQARDTLHDAQSLLSGGGSVQGIINRSYYAMFYAVLALLQGSEKIPSKHGGAISLFDRKFYKTGIFPKQFSQDLHMAFDLRQKSDYRDLVILTRDTAEEVFNKASAFVEAVQKYLTSQVLSKYDNTKEDK